MAANAAAVAGIQLLTSLRQDAATLVRLQPPRNQAPPFDITTIIAIVLVLRGTHLTIHEIVRDVTVTFPYFAEMNLAAMMDESKPNFLSWILDALRDYDTPFYCVARLLTMEPAYYIPLLTVSALFQHYLTPALQPQAPIRWLSILEMPDEHRLGIYKNVLQLPKSGVRVITSVGLPRAYGLSQMEQGIIVVTRLMDKYVPIGALNAFDFSHRASAYHRGYPLKARAVSNLFADLRINMVLWSEATRVYYRINHFVFKSVEQLNVMLNEILVIGPQLLFSLCSISFVYCSSDRAMATHTIGILSQLNLKKIGILMDEQDWRRHQYEDGTEVYTHPREYPGLSILCGIDGLDKIYVEGMNCSRIATYIRQTSSAKQVFRVDTRDGSKVQQ